MALLELKNLKTFFATKRGTVKAVNGVSYSVDAGKVLGVVGESGSGKSVSAMSILRLLDNNGYIDGGEIYFEGRELTKLPMSEMYKIRGNEISVIFQEPMTKGKFQALMRATTPTGSWMVKECILPKPSFTSYTPP